jgi:Ulp1 family protease
MFSSDSTAAMFLRRLYPTNNNRKCREVQQQDNTYDCGVFAIAFPTTLYSGQDPVGKK